MSAVVEETDRASVEDFLMKEIGIVPMTTIAWFRAGVAFYNKNEFFYCLQCLKKSEELDPGNFNVYQLSARVYVKLGRRDLAIENLKKSVKLNNISDWQLLIELSSIDEQSFLATKALISEHSVHSSVEALIADKEKQLKFNT